MAQNTLGAVARSFGFMWLAAHRFPVPNGLAVDRKCIYYSKVLGSIDTQVSKVFNRTCTGIAEWIATARKPSQGHKLIQALATAPPTSPGFILPINSVLMNQKIPDHIHGEISQPSDMIPAFAGAIEDISTNTPHGTVFAYFRGLASVEEGIALLRLPRL
ncbi:hypothetical protein C8R44DRAFT_725637 [Mycena epipterygia]|nr:hypothetical protein C8R44DRAFT_725637 [Mycena epipterygia]